MEPVDYTYDREGRLTKTSSMQEGSTNYHYDPADNLVALSPPDPRNVYQTPEAAHQNIKDNRLTEFNDWRYQYDAFGNLTHRKSHHLDQKYRYDANNRMVGAKGNGNRGDF